MPNPFHSLQDSSEESDISTTSPNHVANTNKQQTKPKKSSKKVNYKKRPVTVILGDSMVKDLKGWELSDEKAHVVVKSFSRAHTNHMKWHVKPTIEQKPENIILHCGRYQRSQRRFRSFYNNIMNLGISIIEESNSNLIISELSQEEMILITRLRKSTTY